MQSFGFFAHNGLVSFNGTGRFTIFNFYFAGETLEEWFQAFGKDLIHMHFIDGFIKKRTYDHLAWGDGEFPLAEMVRCMEKYEYTGYLTQELEYEAYYGNPAEAERKNWKALSGTTLCN